MNDDREEKDRPGCPREDADRPADLAQANGGEAPAAPSKFAIFTHSFQTPGLDARKAETTPLPSPDILSFRPPPAPSPAIKEAIEGEAFEFHGFPLDQTEGASQTFKRKRQAGTPKLGIIGGKGVGKSYLFQAMVSRSFHTAKAGALAYYLDRQSIRLHTAIRQEDPARAVNLYRFIDHYNAWKRLATTMADTQRWYRLSLPYRVGLLGLGRKTLEVEFFEASGEGLLEMEYLGQEEQKLWRDAYLDATVMVFCLPLWAAFPEADLPEQDWQARERVLKGFYQVVFNYQKLREEHRRGAPVRGILALTMADDPRAALPGLRDRWITPYLDTPEPYLRAFATGHGVARYMANARKVSEALRTEFAKLPDFRVSGIPNLLDFGGGPPWLIPMSAIEGKTLEAVEKLHAMPQRGRFNPPVPVHVELPLLVALCEHENALM